MAKKSDNGVIMLIEDDAFDEYIDNYDKVDIADTVEEWFITNGINRNIARHIPSGYDGLKPVARRILLILYEYAKNEYQKVNKISGLVMGSLHPHGDEAISSVIGLMGQSWNSNVCYVEGGGNFGTQKGDPPGAGRYIKCKLSKFAHKCFFEDYKYAALDVVDTYDGKGKEPLYLPAKYPVGLVNPQFASIGVGTASNITPYNFTEVCEATIKLIKDPEAAINLIPDFPNGCDVIADKYLDQVSKTGSGKITVKGEINIDHVNNRIVIRSLPYKVGTNDVTRAIARMKVAKKIEGINKIIENTDKVNGVFVQLCLDKNVNAEDMLQDLFKRNIGLQKTFNVQLKFVEDYKEKEYTPKTYLLNWIEFRREIVQSMHNKKYVKLMEEKHMNDIKLFIFHESRIEETVKLIKSSKNLDEIVEKLVKKFKSACGMTTIQAKTIAMLRMYEFSKEQYKGFLEKDEELKAQIKESENIISNPALIDELIIKELEEGIKLFGTPRKSKIIYEKKSAKNVPDYQVRVVISKDGFIKKLNAEKYSNIGEIGNQATQEIIVTLTRNNKSILLFDSSGKATLIPVSGLPDMTPSDIGVEVNRYFKAANRVVAGLNFVYKEVADQYCMLFITKAGFGKKTSAKEFVKVKTTKNYMQLQDKDELVCVEQLRNDDDRDLIVYTEEGVGIRIPLSEVPDLGVAARGRKIINITDDDKVCGYDLMTKGYKYLFYITASGKAKITETKLFPRMSSKDKPLSLITLNKNDRLVNIIPVNKDDKVNVYKKNGEMECVSINTMTPTIRLAKPEKLVTVGRGDIVIKASRV